MIAGDRPYRAMDKKSYCNIMKIVLFLSLTLGMLSGILRIFNYKETGGGGGWQRFYQMDEECADVFFFGSSHAHCTIDHGILWEDYGLAGYTLSAGSQMIDSTCYFIKETLRTKKPKVIVVEMLGITGGEIVNSDADIYRNVLGMKWSANYGEYMKYLSENMNMGRQQEQEIYFKIPVVHSRYAELTRNDFEDSIPFMVGYRGSYERESFEKPEINGIKETADLNPQRLEMLKEIIDTANAHHVPVVLFASPFVLSAEKQMQFNAVEAFARQQGVPFINYNNLYDEIAIDFETDFRDMEHVNNYGAAKVTRHMAEYLKENYEIADRRGSKGYELWEDNALYLRNKVLAHKLEQAQDIHEYLEIISGMEDGQTVILALTGNYKVLGEVYLDGLAKLGINKEEYEAGGVWIFKDRKRELYFPGSGYYYCMNTDNDEIHVESVIQEAEGELKEKARILIGGKDYAMVENGVNIVVYNETVSQLIDAAGDNVYLGLEMEHCDKEEE